MSEMKEDTIWTIMGVLMIIFVSALLLGVIALPILIAIHTDCYEVLWLEVLTAPWAIIRGFMFYYDAKNLL